MISSYGYFNTIACLVTHHVIDNLMAVERRAKAAHTIDRPLLFLQCMKAKAGRELACKNHNIRNP